MLTDARLLYRARARSPLRRSTVNREIELSQVRGFSVHQGRGIPVGTLLPLLVFLVVTVLVVTGLLAWLNSWLTEPIYFALAEDPRFVPGRGYRPYPNAANEIPAMPFYVPLLAFVSGVAAPLLIGWMLFVLGQLSLSRQTVLAVDLIGASGPVALTGPAEHPTTPLGTSLISQLRRHSAFWGALDASDVSPVVDRGQAQKVADEVGAYLQNLR